MSVAISCQPKLLYLLQAGQNFPNADMRSVKQLCGTMMGGPRLPEV